MGNKNNINYSFTNLELLTINCDGVFNNPVSFEYHYLSYIQGGPGNTTHPYT